MPPTHPTKHNPFDLAPSIYLNPFYNDQLLRTKNNDTDDYGIKCAIDQVIATPSGSDTGPS